MESYVLLKIKILHQLGVYPNKDEERHMNNLKTEIAVDNYAHSLIIHKLDALPI